MRRVLAGRATPAIAVAILAVLGAGGGYAIASGGHGKVHACVQRSTRALYLRSKCAKGEKPVTWNRAGRRGARGRRGFSDGYAASKPNPKGAAIPLNSGFTTVASKTVPAGGYYASEAVEIDGTTGTYAFCFLGAKPASGNTTYVGGGDIEAIDHSDATSISASASGLISTPSTTVLSIQCSVINGTAGIARANLVALRMGAVH